MPSVNRDLFTSFGFFFLSFSFFFLTYFYLPLFLFLSYLIAPVRTSSTMLIGNGKRQHPYLVPDQRGKALTFTVEYSVTCGLFHI